MHSTIFFTDAPCETSIALVLIKFLDRPIYYSLPNPKTLASSLVLTFDYSKITLSKHVIITIISLKFNYICLGTPFGYIGKKKEEGLLYLVVINYRKSYFSQSDL